jgi:hypothetical protein
VGPSGAAELEADRADAQRQLEAQMEELARISSGGAKMGRAAREAAKRQAGERAPSNPVSAAKVEGVRGGRQRGGGGGGNPFGLSSEERARWEADDHLYSDPGERLQHGKGRAKASAVTKPPLQPWLQERRHAGRTSWAAGCNTDAADDLPPPDGTIEGGTQLQ